MVLVALQPEVGGLDLFQPFGLVLAGDGVVGDTVGQDQLGRGEGLALELLLQHVHVVFVDVCVANEVGEPARLVAGEAAHQGQQRGAFSEVEGCAQAHVVAADVQAQRDLALGLVDQELVEQVARRQGHLFQLRPVPAVEEDAAVAGVFDDGVQALAQLVHGLVEQHLLALAIGAVEAAQQLVAARGGVFDLAGLGRRQHLVGRPVAPLHAVHRAQVVFAQAVGVGQPLLVFVGVLVPHLAAQRAELGGVAAAAQETHHLAHGRLEGQLLGGDGRKALLQVETHHGAGHAQGAHAGAVVLPAAGVEDGLNEVEVLFHGGPAKANSRG